MSKILRRPMFRGGPVDSRGTGITSGLMDGGRVGYQSGDIVLGGDLYSKDDYTKFMTNYADNLNKNSALYKSIFTKDDDGEVVIDDDSKYSYENMFGQATGKSEKPQSVFKNVDTLLDSTSSFLPPPGGTQELGTALKSNILEDLKASKQFEVEPARGGGADLGLSTREQDDDDTTGNNTSSTVVDEKDVIRQQAELFKELLGEDKDKRIKDARISDASDYLLKFFEGSQKEGATVGSAAADVAGFATSRDSRTEKAKAANEKIDQTATVLAINDYIAGKRSKEDIQEYFAKIGAKARLDAKSAAEYIQASDEISFAKKVKEGFQSYAGARGASVPSFKETTSVEMKENFKFSPEDIGVIFIETDTNKAYTYDQQGNPIPVYSM